MSVYYVTIGKNEYIIEIINNQFKVNGRIVQSKLIELGERGLYLIKHGTWKQEIHMHAQGPHKYGLDLSGRHVIANVVKNKLFRQRKEQLKSSADVVAPMPGIVMQVQVSEGETVKEGQVLVMMESMKMQMVLKAEQNGVVSKVNAQPKMPVAKGDVLVIIEPEIAESE